MQVSTLTTEELEELATGSKKNPTSCMATRGKASSAGSAGDVTLDELTSSAKLDSSEVESSDGELNVRVLATFNPSHVPTPLTLAMSPLVLARRVSAMALLSALDSITIPQKLAGHIIMKQH